MVKVKEKSRIMVVKRFTFEAAHFLPDYEGQCQHLHGHSYILQVGLSGKVDERGSGMVLDFSLLKQVVRPIVSTLDHGYLNDIKYLDFPNHRPTAEMMILWMKDVIESNLTPLFCNIDVDTWEQQDIQVELIRLYETETSFAEWRRA